MTNRLDIRRSEKLQGCAKQTGYNFRSACASNHSAATLRTRRNTARLCRIACLRTDWRNSQKNQGQEALLFQISARWESALFRSRDLEGNCSEAANAHHKPRLVGSRYRIQTPQKL